MSIEEKSKFLERYFSPSLGVWCSTSTDSKYITDIFNKTINYNLKNKNIKIRFCDVSNSNSDDFDVDKCIKVEFNQQSTIDSNLWYENFKIGFLNSLKPFKHDFTRHLFGCVFVIDFFGHETLEIVNKMNKLFNQAVTNKYSLNSNPMGVFFCTSLIRHYVIINNCSKELNESFEEVYSKLKSIHGDCVHTIDMISSTEMDESHVEDFLIDFYLNSFSPYLNHLSKNLANLVNMHKDKSKSIISSAKKWFNSNNQSPTSNSSLNNTENSIITSLRNENPSTIIRKYADLCLLMGNYLTAHEIFSYYRKIINEKTDFLQLAGSLEMKAISKFLYDGQVIFNYLETSVSSYQIGCSNEECAMRAVLFALDIFISTKNYSKAVFEALKMTSKNKDSVAALFYERMFYIYEMNRMYRKQCFYGYLASLCFFKSGHFHQAYVIINKVLSFISSRQLWFAQAQCTIINNKVCQALNFFVDENEAFGPVLITYESHNVVLRYEIAIFDNILRSESRPNDKQKSVIGLEIQSRFIKIFNSSLSNCTEKYCYLTMMDKCRLGIGCSTCVKSSKNNASSKNKQPTDQTGSSASSGSSLSCKLTFLELFKQQTIQPVRSSTFIRCSFLDFEPTNQSSYSSTQNFFLFCYEKVKVVIPVRNLWLFDIILTKIQLKWTFIDEFQSKISNSSTNAQEYVQFPCIESIKLTKRSRTKIIFGFDVLKCGSLTIHGIEFHSVQADYENLTNQINSLTINEFNLSQNDSNHKHSTLETSSHVPGNYFFPIRFRNESSKHPSIMEFLVDGTRSIISSTDNLTLKFNNDSVSLKFVLLRNKSTYLANEIASFKIQIQLLRPIDPSQIKNVRIWLLTNYQHGFYCPRLKPTTFDSQLLSSYLFYDVDLSLLSTLHSFETDVFVCTHHENFKLCIGLLYSWTDSLQKNYIDMIHDEIDFTIEPNLNITFQDKNNIEDWLLSKNFVVSIDIDACSTNDTYFFNEIVEIVGNFSTLYTCQTFINNSKPHIINSNDSFNIPIIFQVKPSNNSSCLMNKNLFGFFKENDFLSNCFNEYLNQLRRNHDSPQTLVLGVVWVQKNDKTLKLPEFSLSNLESCPSIDSLVNSSDFRIGFSMNSFKLPLVEPHISVSIPNNHIRFNHFDRPIHLVLEHSKQIHHDFNKGFCYLDVVVKLNSLSDQSALGTIEAVQPFKMFKNSDNNTSISNTMDENIIQFQSTNSMNYMWVGLVTQTLSIKAFDPNEGSICEMDPNVFRCCFITEGFYNVASFKVILNLNGRFATIKADNPSFVQIISVSE